MSRASEVESTAIALFYERGYQSTSLQDIADVLKLRAPSLYNHIESKQKLLQVIMFGGIDVLNDEFDAAMAEADTFVMQVEIQTAVLVRHYLRHQKQAYVSRYEIRSLDEPARSELIERRRAYVDRWVRLLKGGVKAGAIEVSDPALIALNIVDLIAGLARWYEPKGRWSERTLVVHYTNLVLSMIGLTA